MTRRDDTILETVRQDLKSWRTTHPQATLAEIDDAVEEQVRQVRARLLEDAVADGFVEEHPVCPHCDTTMVPRTETERTVVVQGDKTVPVMGSYVVCPACGTGLFPPRREP